MRQIVATLPTLGRCPVRFHNESALLLDFLGDRELERLNGIPHLGVASFAFTGLNHTRLEYMLLQCAVIGLLPKFNLDKENLAIAAKVRLGGITTPISSGEELLKCWAVLSNAGHMQYTYGVERSLMIHTQTNPQLAELLIPQGLPRDLRLWCRAVIDEFRYDEFRYLLILRRISRGLPKGSRLKGKLIHIVRNLVLPLDELLPSAPTDRYKLHRLRTVFQHVRLLSMVTLDAYYSHHPIRYQIGGAIMDLANLVRDPTEGSEFLSLLHETAGFLADELYLHQGSVALQRAYELTSLEKMNTKLAKSLSTPDGMSSVLRDARYNGFGKPRTGVLEPLFRISFEPAHQQLLGTPNEYARLVSVESQLANSKTTFAAVNKNSTTDVTHVDVLYTRDVSVNDVGEVCRKTFTWLTRAVRAEILRRQRWLPRGRPDGRDALRRNQSLLERRVRSPKLIRRIVEGVISFLLPDGYTGSISQFLPTRRNGRATSAFPARFHLSDELSIDDIAEDLNDKLAVSGGVVDPGRLQELHALKHIYDRSGTPFAIACMEKFIVRDSYNKAIDEWDGLLLEISEKRVKLTIIEAKQKTSASASESAAMKQLVATRTLLRSRRHPRTRRSVIPKLGAALTVSLLG